MTVEQEISVGVEALTLDVIVEGPSSEGKKFVEKTLKKVVKEGGKRGVEIEGAADMGGLKFFCTTVQEPAADLDLTIETMKAMNAKSDPTAEERKGGAGKLGKIVISSTEQKIAMVAYVPKDLSKECNALEWLTYTVSTVIGNKDAFESAATIASCEGVDSANYATCVIVNNPEKNVFALKLRDAMISIAYNYLKARDLFPENDEDDEDDYVFGDDDFPDADDVEEEVVEEKVEEEVVEVEEKCLLCPIAERLTTDKIAKKLAKVVKEGGKRGVEIEGAADMGGLQFFCTQMDLPADDIDMLVESMRAMNAKSDPTAEERKGGAGRLGKTILSMTDAKICLVAYIPALAECDKTEEISASEWLVNTVTCILKSGKHDDTVGEEALKLVESFPGNERTFAKAVIMKDGAKGLFPLKMKDEAINQGYAYLKARGLFPDGNDDDDDDYCWGDEDFPEEC